VAAWAGASVTVTVEGVDTGTSSRSTADEVTDVACATSFNIVYDGGFDTTSTYWLADMWTALGLASHVLVSNTGTFLAGVSG
jgi:hypothetical protein